MCTTISVQGRNGRVLLRSLDYVRESVDREMGGAFLINIKTKEYLLVRTKHPYKYLTEVYRARNIVKKTNASLMMRCAENTEDLYVLIPQSATVKNFQMYEHFPLDGFSPFVRAARGSHLQSTHVSNKETTVYRIKDSISGFTFYTSRKPKRPKQLIVCRLKAMLNPHHSDDLIEDKLSVTKHIQQTLRSMARMAERNICTCTVLTQTIDRESKHLAIDIETKNKSSLAEWLNTMKSTNPSQLTATT